MCGMFLPLGPAHVPSPVVGALAECHKLPSGENCIHLDHVFQERSQLSWVIGKDWDELFWIGL